MRCVSIATCTSGDPVSPGCVAYSSMIAFLTSDSSAIDGIPFLLIARRPSPDARALFIRGRSNGNLKSLPVGRRRRERVAAAPSPGATA